ncbi:MAG: methyl-accepting chemotaxis protein [Azonexus sp.]|jgi:methyl-accepting chemotaxis protein|nr:methyl-accepting chemotaxis protein [Azonexus sp.]
MTLSKRLLILMGTSILALIIVTALSLYEMGRVYKAANFGNENVVPSILLLDEAILSFGQLRVRVYRHVLTKDPKAQAEVEATIEKGLQNVEKALKAYEPMVMSPEDQRLLDEDVKTANAYKEFLKPLLADSRQGKTEDAIHKLQEATAVAKHLNEALEAHMEFNAELGKKTSEEGAAAKNFATWSSLIVSGIAILIVGGLAFQIRSSLTARLQEAGVLANAIAGGDLSNRNTPRSISDDEAGQLIQSMEKMRQDLARTVGQIASNSDQLSSSAAQLSITAQQVSASTQSQSSSTASSAAAVEELTVSIDHVGASADDASDRARAAGDLAVDSGKGVQSATSQINKVARSVEDTAHQIHTLSEHIQKVGNITTVIREVADQTNLLALNAAIEAARAGEQGRGFAVVADEVRKLAERTTLSVQEISTVISTIQSSVSVAVSGMQENCTLVAGVVQSAESASNSMEGIRGATEMVRDAITGISEAMREQRSASTELSRNVEAIAQMSEENSAAVASVADTASMLVNVSNNLKTAVAGFRL